MNYLAKILAWREGFGLCVKLSVLLLLLPTLCSAQAATKLTAHMIGIVQSDGKAGICSATAVGPSLLLTATHCLGHGGVESLTIDGKPATILLVERDNADHALVRVSAKFQHFAKLGRPPIQGDQIHYYGNPGVPDQYRKGYVTGLFPSGGYLFDANCYMGDSGAGLFGADGLLKGVLSGFVTSDTFKLCIGYPLAFTAEQWARVR